MRSSRLDSIDHGAKTKTGEESVPAHAGSAAKHFGGKPDCPLNIPVETHEIVAAASANVLNRPRKPRRVEIAEMFRIEEVPIPKARSTCTDPMQVALVDHEEGMRWFLPRILDRSVEFRCNGWYESAEEAIHEVPRVGAELVLMSIQLPEMSGIECMRRLRSVLPRLGVDLVSELADLQIMSDALNAGADGYLIKPFAIAQCLATLRLATRREMPATTSSVDVALPSVRRGDGCARLTRRENEVMTCLADGLLYKEIADKLGISFSAVNKHQHSIFRKLHVNNRTEGINQWRDSKRA